MCDCLCVRWPDSLATTANKDRPCVSPAPHLQLPLVVLILPGQEVDLLEQLLLMVLQLTHGGD
jgi:hypothetical protein